MCTYNMYNITIHLLCVYIYIYIYIYGGPCSSPAADLGRRASRGGGSGHRSRGPSY